MPDADESIDITVIESEATPADSLEYDFSMIASATVTGPRGTLRIHRRYYALPRHNDVVERKGADSNDELLNRADEIYAHSKFYDVTDEGDDYFLDHHETLQPEDLAALSDEAAFYEVCEAHHLADVRTEYTGGDERTQTEDQRIGINGVRSCEVDCWSGRAAAVKA